jgi:peptide/nickel transport system permease protein
VSKRSRWITCGIVFGALHLMIACAGFFAPYDPAMQNREQPYWPPARLHLFESNGQMHFCPFFYASAEAAGERIPLRFFVRGQPYRLFGVLPSRVHLFGTDSSPIFLLGSDSYGRDLFSRILVGGQVSLLAGLAGTGISLGMGLLVGVSAGFWGGWTDGLLMRLAELFMALPWIYLLFALRAFLPLAVPPASALLLVIAVIGAVGWARPARLVRSVVLSAKERDFVRAARGFGASNLYLMRRHILPETSSVLLTQAALLIPQFILAEMTLSFLGLGVPEPVPSWGNLLSSLQQYSVLASYWWMYLPALALVPFFLGYLVIASLLQDHRLA